MSDKDGLEYRLARSTVRITGQATDDFDPTTSQARVSATSDVAVGVEADPSGAALRKLATDSNFFTSKQLTIALAPDGRLTSTSGSSEGAGASVIEAGVRIVGFLGATLVGAMTRSIAPPPEKIGKTFDETLSEENSDLHDRREAYKRAVGELQTAIAALGARAAASPGVVAAVTEGRTLEVTLARVRGEAAAVEAEYDAWVARRFPAATEAHEFVVGVDELPRLETATATATFDGLPQALADAAEKLGVVVALIEAAPGEPSQTTAGQSPKAAEGISYRTARRALLATYKRTPREDKDEPFKLGTVTPTWVVDGQSHESFLDFDSGMFGKTAGTLDFGETGAPSKLSSSNESAAKQISAALSAAPGALKESFEQAAAVTDEMAKLRSAGAERRIADIDRRRKLLEAEIAEKGVLATKSQRERLERLKVDKDVAEIEKALAPTPDPPPSPNKELEEKITRMRLELEVRQMQFETAWLTRLSPLAGDGGVPAAGGGGAPAA